MTVYQKTQQLSDDQFLRDVGLSQETFQFLLEKIARYIETEKSKNPIKQRGRKDGISLEERLLLTLTYLRHYPTFAKLGKEFSISESYANKIYHRIVDILLKVLPFKNKKELMSADLQAVAIDVTEQRIQRPKKRQRAYYSGKKNSIR